jgi:hypothetical protein
LVIQRQRGETNESFPEESLSAESFRTVKPQTDASAAQFTGFNSAEDERFHHRHRTAIFVNVT